MDVSFGLIFPVTRPVASPSLFEQITLLRVLEALLLIAFTWLSIRYLGKALEYLGSFSHRARFVVRWVQPVVRIVFWFGALLLAFYLLVPNDQMFVAGLGSAAIAVGLGAQDLVRNLLAGLVILADRPFQLGDRVEIGEAYGEVIHIGLVSTAVTTPDDSEVTIPNSQVISNGVSNANSGETDCQVVTDLYLPLATDPRLAQKIGYEAAYASQYLLVSKPVVVLLHDVLQGRSHLRLRIKAYVYDHQFEPAMQSDITIRAKSEFLRLGLLPDWREPAQSSGTLYRT